MHNEKQDDAACHRCIGDVKHRPAGEVVAEDIDIEEIRIDKIDHLAIKQSAVIEEDAVKHAVDEVADGAAENHCEGEAVGERLVAHLIEIDHDADACNDRNYREEQFAADIDAKRHAGIFDICES